MNQSINNFISRYHIEHLSDKEKKQLAQDVLDNIKTTGCIPTPIHYTVIYESVVNIDPALGSQIKSTIDNHLYTNNIAEDFFRDLIIKYLLNHMPSQQVEELLKKLLNQMDLWVKQTEKNQKAIKDSVEDIQTEEIPIKIKNTLEQEIIPAINDILVNTNSIKEEAFEASSEIELLRNQLEQAYTIAKTDELTKLPNRRSFNEEAQNMLARTLKKEFLFSMILIDIDFFKFINDEHGHLVGDSVLRYIANLLKKETKGKDFVGRYGGEEFVVLLPYTNYQNAMLVADSLRKKISAITLKVKNAGTSLKLNISAGVATYNQKDNIETMLERADKALYSAKNNGRNQVKGEQDI